jgi:hypothetical protein
MLEQELLKFYKIYQTSVAARANDALSKIAIKTYARLSSWVLPIKDEEKLFSDLRNDYALMSELDKWIGYICLKMGLLTALASTSLITVNNCDYKLKQPEVSQVTEKTLKPIKVHSEKQLAWSRQLGKRCQEFKRAKRQK